MGSPLFSLRSVIGEWPRADGTKLNELSKDRFAASANTTRLISRLEECGRVAHEIDPFDQSVLFAAPTA